MIKCMDINHLQFKKYCTEPKNKNESIKQLYMHRFSHDVVMNKTNSEKKKKKTGQRLIHLNPSPLLRNTHYDVSSQLFLILSDSNNVKSWAHWYALTAQIQDTGVLSWHKITLWETTSCDTCSDKNLGSSVATQVMW